LTFVNGRSGEEIINQSGLKCRVLIKIEGNNRAKMKTVLTVSIDGRILDGSGIFQFRHGVTVSAHQPERYFLFLRKGGET
jgi:hypothetical protein